MESGPEVIDDRYEVGAVIGRGGMGDVHHGRDLRLGREVAIKFLRADLAAQPLVRTRFEDEARAAARLSHPSVVIVFDSGEAEGRPYLVMECLPGRTLADELVEGPISEERAMSVAADMLGALEAAHRLGIIHRDVKPGNILWTSDGRAKLADFGIAKSAEALDHTMTGQIIGTPAYLAPERLEGRPATPESDLYSLGVVLYEALIGVKPFQSDTPIGMAYAIHAGPAPLVQELRPDVDPRLAATIDGALVKEPEQRFRSAQEMRAALTGASLDDAADPTVSISQERSRDAAPTLIDASTMPATRTRDLRQLRADLFAWWRARSREERRGVAIVAMVVAVGVMLTLVAGRGTGTNGVDPTIPPSTGVPISAPGLSPPLDDAIRDLEDAVSP